MKTRYLSLIAVALQLNGGRKMNKSRDWIEYAASFIISALTIYILYSSNYLDILSADHFNNERYVLSALLQSEAAILAIVVSLSLIAVQLTASSYSPRVVELFKGWENLDLWFLVSVYVFTMGFTALTLKNIGNDNLNWKVCTTVSVFLAIWCFISLVPYTRRLLDFLKPSTSIKKFARRIDKKSLTRAFTEADKIKIEELDPIQPIVDIAYNALQKRDLETVRNSLKAIVSRVIILFNNSEIKDGDKILVEVVTHLRNVGDFSIELNDWDSIRYVIDAIKEIGTKAAEMNFHSTIFVIFHTLRRFINYATKENVVIAYIYSISSIGEIGKSAARNGQVSLVFATLNNLESLSEFFINKERKIELDAVATKIKEICENISKDINKDSRNKIVDHAILILGNMGKTAQSKKIDSSYVDWCIEEIEKIRT